MIANSCIYKPLHNPNPTLSQARVVTAHVRLTGMNSTGEANTGMNSTAQANTGTNSTVQANTGTNSTVQANTGTNSTVQANTGTNSTVQANTGTNSTVQFFFLSHGQRLCSVPRMMGLDSTCPCGSFVMFFMVSQISANIMQCIMLF
uniref:Uncharacterized protein n=1 Tax=Periophthalmus magnuspinnatus TaxID=409849 RepID=A0A3B3Z6A4_9GOBI